MRIQVACGSQGHRVTLDLTGSCELPGVVLGDGSSPLQEHLAVSPSTGENFSR